MLYGQYDVHTLCEAMNVSRGTFYNHVRYRNDWHIGAMPERYTYDKTGQKQPLNELALDLAPGEYGRAVCNGGSGTGIQESGIMYWIF